MRSTFFVHGSRTKAERPFDAELATLVRQGQGAITVVQALSQPEDAAVEGADYAYAGRVDVDLLKAALPLDDYDYFLCGPATFTQGLYDALRALRKSLAVETACVAVILALVAWLGTLAPPTSAM